MKKNHHHLILGRIMMEKKRRKPIVAAILSSLAPGLGQLYNGQIIKGIIFLLSLILLPIIMFRLGLHHSFYGLAIILLIFMFLLLFIIGEAFYAATKKKEFILKGYNKWYIYLLIILLINSTVLIPTNYLSKVLRFSAFKMPTASMVPTLHVGDHLIANLKYFRKYKVQRQGLVMLQSPQDPAKIFIKRIIAFEGEKIEIKSKQVYINDVPLQEGYKIHLDSDFHPGRDNYGPAVVPSDRCFVLGDNRDKSIDSRHWDSVPLKNIKGKPLYIYWAQDITRIGMKIE
jgi:signal peptidase I